MTQTQQFGEWVRVPYVFGDEVLRYVSTNTFGDRVEVEVPVEDGSGRIVEYMTKWVAAERVEPA